MIVTPQTDYTPAALRRARLYAADAAARLMAQATTPQAVAEACMPATLDRLAQAYLLNERATLQALHASREDLLAKAGRESSLRGRMRDDLGQWFMRHAGRRFLVSEGMSAQGYTMEVFDVATSRFVVACRPGEPGEVNERCPMEGFTGGCNAA